MTGTRTLAAKTVIVTGGTSGMGRAMAFRAAADGAFVVLAGRDEEAGKEIVAVVEDNGGSATFVRTDVTVEEDAEALVEHALRARGRVDCVFNNAGAMAPAGLVPEVDTNSWRAGLEVNLTSVFFGLKYQIPALVAGGGGAIVNNASLLGVRGIVGASAYVAAKHGVIGLTRAAALEFAAQGVRVNALVTGPVDTPGLCSTSGDACRAELVADAVAHTPAGRIGEPEEVAAFATFLLGDEAKFITGAALAIDGGMSA